ncbi:hypothetical protein ACFLR1_05380 [Bacteroidota bacterium]
MIGYRKALLVLLALVISVGTANAQRRPKDKILDRNVFIVRMELQSKKKKNEEGVFDDEISFRSGKMGSIQMMRKLSFQRGEYAIYDIERGSPHSIIKFNGINRNEKGFSLKWKGEVIGRKIEGTAIVSKNGKIKKEYTFSGEQEE